MKIQKHKQKHMYKTSIYNKYSVYIKTTINFYIYK